MIEEITRELFTVPRTPADLNRFFNEAYDFITHHEDIKALARLRKEPYKTFIEELMPFAHFCSWKYGTRDDVLCSLVPGTPGRDAVVTERTTGNEHSVEITWPIDGRGLIEEMKELNEEGWICHVTDFDDTSAHEAAITRTLEIARKKAIRDYRSRGGSTIIFVFDLFQFWDSNPEHQRLLNELRAQLASVRLLAESVLLMCILGDKKTIEELKAPNQAIEAIGDPGSPQPHG